MNHSKVFIPLWQFIAPTSSIDHPCPVQARPSRHSLPEINLKDPTTLLHQCREEECTGNNKGYMSLFIGGKTHQKDKDPTRGKN